MQLKSTACFSNPKRSSEIVCALPKKSLYTEKKGCFGEGNPPQGIANLILLPSSKHKTMKTIVTLIALTFFGIMAQAQDVAGEAKVEGIVLGVKTDLLMEQARKDRNITRLYKFKNSRVKKALSFTTKNNASKLA